MMLCCALWPLQGPRVCWSWLQKVNKIVFFRKVKPKILYFSWCTQPAVSLNFSITTACICVCDSHMLSHCVFCDSCQMWDAERFPWTCLMQFYDVCHVSKWFVDPRQAESLPQSLPALDLSLFIRTQTDRAASQLVTVLYLSWFRYKHRNPQTCPTDLHVTEGRCCIMSVNYDCPCSLEQPCTRLMGFPNACISMQERYSCNSVNLRGCFLFDRSPVLVSRGNILSSWSLACKYGLVIDLGLQGYGGGVPWAPRLQDRWPFYFGCGPSFLDKETDSDLCFYCWSVCTFRDEVR